MGYVLQNLRDMFFLEVLGAAGSTTHTHTLLEDFKNRHKDTKFVKKLIKPIRYMLQNSRTCFSGGSEAPQAVHHTRTLLGDSRTGTRILEKTTNMNKTHKAHAPKFQVMFFWGF